MKHPGKIAAALFVILMILLYNGWIFTSLAVMLIVVLLPPKYDPLTQFKEQNERRK